MSKHSISLDQETELLMQHMKLADEKLSHFLQRMVKEAAQRKGLVVETRVVKNDDSRQG